MCNKYILFNLKHIHCVFPLVSQNSSARISYINTFGHKLKISW